MEICGPHSERPIHAVTRRTWQLYIKSIEFIGLIKDMVTKHTALRARKAQVSEARSVLVLDCPDYINGLCWTQI